MSSIFDELITGWDTVASHLHHHHDGHPAAATQGDTMATLTDIQNLVAEGVGNIKGWAQNLEDALPHLAAKAALIDSSPVVAELVKLGSVALPPEIEAAVVGLIQLAGKAAAGAAAAVAAPAAPEPVQPAEGEPAEAAPAA